MIEPPRRPRVSLVAGFKQMLSLLLVSLIPVVSGLLILYWQVDRSLMHGSQEVGERAIAHLDRTIERADDLTARATALAGRECAEILDPMRRLVTAYPTVRSMVIGDTQTLYCGTEFGALDMPISEHMAFAGKLYLRPGSPPAPDQPSLVFRRFEGRFTLNAVIDAQVLAQVIGYARNGADVVLEQNGLFLGEDGNISPYRFEDHGEHHAVQLSSLYGYRVHSGYAPGYSRQAFKAQAWPLLGTLVLLGVITAGVCHRISRPGSNPPPRP